MHNRVAGSIAVLALMTVFSSAALAQRGGGTRGAAPAAPSVPHDPHDLTGVWLGGGGGGGNRNPVTQWLRQAPPLTAEGKAKMDSNKSGKGPRAVMPALGNDPIGDANPPGLMRTLVYNRPLQIINAGDQIVTTGFAQLADGTRVRVTTGDGAQPRPVRPDGGRRQNRPITPEGVAPGTAANPPPGETRPARQQRSSTGAAASPAP